MYVTSNCSYLLDVMNAQFTANSKHLHIIEYSYDSFITSAISLNLQIQPELHTIVTALSHTYKKTKTQVIFSILIHVTVQFHRDRVFFRHHSLTIISLSPEK